MTSLNKINPFNKTNIPLFTPVYFNKSAKSTFPYSKFAEEYFDYGGRKVITITSSEMQHCFNGKMEGNKKKNLLIVVLKIISLVTIIVPLIMMALKAQFRLKNKFTIEKIEPKEKQTDDSGIILLGKGNPLIMSVGPEIKFNAAMKLYDKKDFDQAVKQFSNLAVNLFLTKGASAMDQIEQAMQMTIASYKKINNEVVSKILEQSEDNLFEQFFSTMRHYMDYRIETDPAIVDEEITKEIPLGKPEVRTGLFPEGDTFLEENKAGPFRAAIMSAQGPREEMEDEHLVTELYLKKDGQEDKVIQMFAVFDGHGGISCAYYVKQKLAEFLQEELQNLPSFSNLEIHNALQRAFIKIDKSWAELPFQFTDRRDYSGTTATVSLVIDDALWVANVGDSRTVLAAGNKAVQLSEEAKATVEKYAKEIYCRGGDIANGRVVNLEGSSLDMARSIGDVDQHSVSALPTIRKFDLKTLGNEENYLILGCDGLWDVVSPQMAVDICKKSKDLKEAAQKLEQAAFLSGSTDNVTVMVVGLTH